MNTTKAEERVAGLFVPGGRLHGQYSPPQGDDLVEVVPGVVWQIFVFPTGSACAQVLRVYALDNGNAILERFWRNEVRALHRLAARGHTGLPKLVGAAGFRELGLGCLILEDAGDPLEDPHPRLDLLRGDRLLALKAVADLTSAVSVLHTEGFLHRSVSPHVILAPKTGADGKLRLDGFQMSAYVRGLLRGVGDDADEGATAFLPTDPASAICLAPERLASIMNGTMRSLESFACDVFGLGMVAIDWFAGPSDEANCRAVFDGGRYSDSAHRKVICDAQERIRNAGIPSELRQLLEQMIAPAAANRPPSALDVAQTLAQLYGGLVAQFQQAEGATPPKPRLVYFLQETVEHFYREGLGVTTPEQPDEQEYADLVREDLAGGTMGWSPRGFEPWVRTGKEKARRARVVLFGKAFAYFCQLLDEGGRSEDLRILLVKYPCPLYKVRDLAQGPLQRPLPPATVMFFDPNRRRRPVPNDAPGWMDEIESVKVEDGGEVGSPVAACADWLVGYQEGILAAQEFTYEQIIPEGKGATEGSLPVVLRSKGSTLAFDPSDRVSAFLELLRREGLVCPMGECFEQEHQQGLSTGDRVVFEVLDPNGKPVDLKLEFDERLDDDTVRFRAIRQGERIPPNGRIRSDDRATRVCLERQQWAVRELTARHDLLAQLREPRGISYEKGVPRVPRPDETLDPETTKLIDRILSEEPLFCLQAGPGTGKTFVATRAMRDYLRAEPLSRVLVSAQANAATDNILETLVPLLQMDGGWALVLRHASPESLSKLSKKARSYTLDEQVAAQRRHIDERLNKAGPLSLIQKQWRRLAKVQDLDAELFARLPRAANVVFATSIGAGAEVGALRDGPGFDWVVVEEAAHAWLSEIAVPLVQGSRWLLIGDHAQLPAYGAEDVHRVFGRDVEEQVTADATGRMPSESWKPFLSHFKHFMEVPGRSGRWTEPRARIDVQRRMARDIGDLISHAYYEDLLTTHPDTERPHLIQGNGLGFLSKMSLVWFDTSGFGEDAEEHGYKNELELHLLRAFLGRVRTFPLHDQDKAPVAIISPYKAQLNLLAEKARNHSDLTDDCFRTVDSVQGREAEVVIVSLVRNNSQMKMGKALGFLQSPERANVMFSRARRLLVIIGSLNHFARFPGTHWGKVVEYVRSPKDRFVVDPVAALSFQPPWRRQ